MSNNLCHVSFDVVIPVQNIERILCDAFDFDGDSYTMYDDNDVSLGKEHLGWKQLVKDGDLSLLFGVENGYQYVRVISCSIRDGREWENLPVLIQYAEPGSHVLTYDDEGLVTLRYVDVEGVYHETTSFVGDKIGDMIRAGIMGGSV